jgi:hypothetical protein
LLFLPEITSDEPSLTRRNPRPSTAQRTKEQSGGLSLIKVQPESSIHTVVSAIPAETCRATTRWSLGRKKRQLDVATCRSRDTKR